MKILLIALAGIAAMQIKGDRLAALIKAQDYAFSAQTALPLGGRTKNLTPGYYDLKISKDTIACDLPYYGRAYAAPSPSGGGGLKFTSTKFTYTVTPGKKSGWNIAIKFSDAGDVTQMYMNIGADGYANLQVTSINRQAIGFNGIIEARRMHR
jgi:hypothetical protein